MRPIVFDVQFINHKKTFKFIWIIFLVLLGCVMNAWSQIAKIGFEFPECVRICHETLEFHWNTMFWLFSVFYLFIFLLKQINKNTKSTRFSNENNEKCLQILLLLKSKDRPIDRPNEYPKRNANEMNKKQ